MYIIQFFLHRGEELAMRIEQLEYFSEVSKCRSLTIAAEHLYVTQSTLSKAISSLERELGGDLIKRSADGVCLTEEGVTLLPLIEDILQKIDNLNLSAKNLFKNQPIGNEEIVLNIYANTVIVDALFPVSLRIFKGKYPNVHIKVNNIMLHEAENEIYKGNQAIYLINNLNNLFADLLKNSAMHCKRLFVESYSIVVNKLSPLAKNKIVSITEIMQYKLIFNYSGINYQELFEKILDKHYDLDIILNTNNIDIIKKLLADRDSVYIAPNCLANKYFKNCSDLLVIPIRTGRGIICALFLENHPHINIIEDLLEIITSNRCSI